MEKIREFLREFGVLVVIGMVGVGVLIYGLWGELMPEKAGVEIVKGDVIGNIDNMGEITVDVAGAVEKPGVYKLPSGSRNGDALVMAGGLSAKADREWVAKSLNLAEVVKDGGKIYIPRQLGNSDIQRIGESVNQTSAKVNINTASLGELDSLVGIGEARARTILDNRPYANTQELVSKAKIPQSVYDKIKDSIVVY